MVKLTAVAACAVAVTAAVSACSPGQNASNQTGTVPPVKSGPASSVPGSNPPLGGEALTAQLKTPDGRAVANAKFEFTANYVTVTVTSAAPGLLAPGLHNMHVHQFGKCEADSVAPNGGPPGNFLSAGEHFQAPGHTGKPASGDLTALEVRSDGSAYLVTTTDAFTRQQLLAGDRTALMLHGAQDTDDAMQRIACGVIGPAT